MSKTNKIHAVAYTVLGLIIITLTVLWAMGRKRANELSVAVNNSYDRAFFELTDYVSDIDTLLSKAQLASSPAQMASISNEIFMQAAEAKSCFGELPPQNSSLENTAKFLSQVGDYTYVLSQNMINGAAVSQEEYETLGNLNQYASELSKHLGQIKDRIYSDGASFETASAKLFTPVFAAGGDIMTDLENVEKTLEGYPSLIYDGPFSEHIENMQSVMINSASEISQEDALQKAREFLGSRGDGLEYSGDMTNTAIEAYTFGSDRDGTSISLGITKRGGYVLYFLENRDVNESKYDVASATESAMRFLEAHGFTDMADSYYEVRNNIATINFAYMQNGVKCYSDLVKVRVALDNGEIIGMESKGYLMNHREREIPGAVMTEEEAKTHVSTHLAVEGVSLAIVPKDSLKEVLCYEFKGTYMDKNFIVYINAENGREENILLLIESETGILTI